MGLTDKLFQVFLVRERKKNTSMKSLFNFYFDFKNKDFYSFIFYNFWSYNSIKDIYTTIKSVWKVYLLTQVKDMHLLAQENTQVHLLQKFLSQSCLEQVTLNIQYLSTIQLIRTTRKPSISSCRVCKKHKTTTDKQERMGKLLNSVPTSPVEELLSCITSAFALRPSKSAAITTNYGDVASTLLNHKLTAN